jgi:hypothetical protein
MPSNSRTTDTTTIETPNCFLDNDPPVPSPPSLVQDDEHPVVTTGHITGSGHAATSTSTIPLPPTPTPLLAMTHLWFVRPDGPVHDDGPPSPPGRPVFTMNTTTNGITSTAMNHNTTASTTTTSSTHPRLPPTIMFPPPQCIIHPETRHAIITSSSSSALEGATSFLTANRYRRRRANNGNERIQFMLAALDEALEICADMEESCIMASLGQESSRHPDGDMSHSTDKDYGVKQ